MLHNVINRFIKCESSGYEIFKSIKGINTRNECNSNLQFILEILPNAPHVTATSHHVVIGDLTENSTIVKTIIAKSTDASGAAVQTSGTIIEGMNHQLLWLNFFNSIKKDVLW